ALFVADESRVVFRTAFDEVLGRPFEAGSAQSIDIVGLRRDNVPVPLEVSLAPLEVEGEHSVLAVVRDVTERRQVERALHETREAALEASRLKSEFLA